MSVPVVVLPGLRHPPDDLGERIPLPLSNWKQLSITSSGAIPVAVTGDKTGYSGLRSSAEVVKAESAADCICGVRDLEFKLSRLDGAAYSHA